MNRTKVLGTAACLVLLAAAGCRNVPEERAWMVMGTFASVSAASGDRARIDEAESTVSAEFTRLERLWSYFDRKSEISRLNSGTAEPVMVSPDTLRLIRESVSVARGSGGCFDPTVGPLVDLWGIGGRREFRVPEESEIYGAMKRCGWEKLAAGDDGTVRFMLEGMRFDAGGIAKGLAVDMGADLLAGAGMTDFMVNLGGNLKCYGRGRNGRDWKVGVQNPFERGKVVGILGIGNGMAVATSGNYERFIEKDGHRYAHIIDPASGRPVEGMAGVTVTAPSAMLADGLSTALFVAGLKRAGEVLAAYPDVDAILIPDSKPAVLYVTEGIIGRFRPEEGVTVRQIQLP